MASVRRPTSITVLAILNFVFGAYGLLGVVIGTIGLVAVLNATPAPLPDKPAAPTDFLGVTSELNRFILNESPNHKPVMAVIFVVGLLRTALLFISGIGLLKMKSWGRTAAFAFVVVGLIGTAIEAGYGFAVTAPATQKWEKERGAKLQANGMTPPPATAGITGVATAGLGAFCGVLYPVIVLVLLLTPSARAAFSDKPIGDQDRFREPEDELDDDRPLRHRDEMDNPPRRDDDDRFRTGRDR